MRSIIWLLGCCALGTAFVPSSRSVRGTQLCAVSRNEDRYEVDAHLSRRCAIRRASAAGFLSVMPTPTRAADSDKEAAAYKAMSEASKAGDKVAYQKALAEAKAARKFQDPQIVKDITRALKPPVK